jgi:hypothetical protein
MRLARTDTVAAGASPAGGEAMSRLRKINLDLGRRMWWLSSLARTPDPAPAELSQERVGALAGEMA